MNNNRRFLYTYVFSVLLLLVISICYDSLNPYLEAFGLIFSLGLGFAYLIIRDRSRPIRIPKALVVIGSFLLYYGLLILRSPQPLPGLEKWAINLLVFLAFFIVSDSLETGWSNKTWENALLNLALVFSLLEITLTGVWFLRWANIAGTIFSVPPVGYRLYGLFIGHANVFSGYLNLLLPIIMVRLIQSRNTRRRLLWGFVIGIFILVQYFASSRGGWISAIAGLGITMILIRWPRIREYLLRGRRVTIQRKTFKDIAIYAVGAAGIIALGIIFILQVQFSPGHAPITSARTEIWSASLEIISLSPIFGHGPGSFSTLFAQTNQLPPGFSTSHAHNALLQITAQSGLVGLGLIIAAGVMLAVRIISIYQRAEATERIRLSAYIGAGVAVAVHHLFDYLFESPAYSAAVFVLLALALRQSRGRGDIIVSPRQGIVVFLPLLLLAAGGWSLASQGAFTYWRGISAARVDDYQVASENLCRAAEENPAFSLYSFQCGLALAYLDDQAHDVNHLQKAIGAYEHGLSIDPFWPPHQANYAALLWVIGEQEDALHELNLACESAPRHSILYQNAGMWLETLQRPADAQSEYFKALESGPHIADSNFFELSSIRAQALSSFIEEQNLQATGTTLMEGWESLQDNHLLKARTAFTHALDENPLSVEAYRGLAQTALLLDEFVEAQKLIDTARFIGGSSTRVNFTAGEIALERGDLPAAASLIQQGFNQIFEQSSSWSFYARTYGRFFPVPDLVPQLYRINLNEKDLRMLATVIDYLNEQGNFEEASYIERKLLQEGYID
ncbi:MAG: O-antigen ligase family protein [Anaerolineales bacterium]